MKSCIYSCFCLLGARSMLTISPICVPSSENEVQRRWPPPLRRRFHGSDARVSIQSGPEHVFIQGGPLAGGTNGMFFDSDNNLIVARVTGRAISTLDGETGQILEVKPRIRRQCGIS